MASCPKCKRVFTEALTACPHDGEVLIPEISAANDQELQRGSTVGEYVIEGKLGSGTFGHVYRAVQPLIAKQVAIKVLSRKYSADPDIVSRFIAEARAVNQIRHRNIIDIFSFGQLPDGRHYHIMELLSGTTLDVHLKQRGRLALVEAILILRPLARALDAAHASGIAHRDLKPANVFLGFDDDGKPFPKLLDFGIAKLLSDQLPRQHQTATGAAVGTPDYMSPEQCQGPDVDHRTDIYAFGIMTYQLITGVLPHVGNNVVEVLVKQMTAQPVPPSKVHRDIPLAVDAPVMWMLAKDKRERPPDLATAIGALETALNASGIEVPRSAITGDPVIGSRLGKAELPADASRSRPGVDPAFTASVPPLLSARPATLADPALSATLPSEGRVTALPAAERRASRRVPLMLFLIGVVIAGALGFMALSRPPQVTVEEPAVQAALQAHAEEPPTPVVEKPAEAPTVELRVQSTPHEIDILGPGGVVLGRTPAAIRLPRSMEKLHLEFRAPGYVSESREITPLADGEISVTLSKAPEKKPVTKKITKTKKTKKAGADDIESFD